MLGILANWLAAALLAFTIFFYVVVYTMWLKRSTPQNIVIGGAAGALPPVVGLGRGDRLARGRADAAVRDHLLLDAAAFLGAGAVPRRRLRPRRRADAAGGAGPDATRLQILLYTLVLVAVALAPWPLGYFSAVYGVTSLALGGGMLWLRAAGLSRAQGQRRRLRAARNLFRFSILYLFALFAVLLLEVVARRHAGRCSAEEVRMVTATPPPDRIDGIVLTPAQKKSQRERSIAIALALLVLVVLFFVVTMVKGPGVLVRPL